MVRNTATATERIPGEVRQEEGGQGMTIHYIVLVHRYPDQLGHLVRRLQAPDVLFHVHVERTSDEAPFREAVEEHPNVLFVAPRETSPVGDIGIVKATLHAMHSVVASGRPGTCVLLSGQCWPIRSNSAIRTFLEAHRRIVFMEVHAPPTPATQAHGFIKPLSTMRQRTELFKFNHSTARGGYFLLPSVWSWAFWKEARKHLAQVRYLLPRSERPLWPLFTKRRFPSDTLPYYGSQWWTMPVSVVREVLDLVDRRPDLLRFHTFSLLPDEMFFQSVVMALRSEDPAIRVEPSTTYADWLTQERPRPPVMRMERFEQLTSMPPHVLFARKFDRTVDAAIFDRLDAHNDRSDGDD